jgi:hypothetical protein
MKKLVLSVIALAMVSMMAISCGPTAKQVEEKRIADSTAAAQVDTTAVQTVVDTTTVVK